jgi:UDP-N-acetylmuramate--alanine ligase
MQKTLANFSGVWRRFEVLGSYKGATVISDYAHHPTAVASTIKAAKEFYPGRRIVAVFQPHQRSRTKKLFEGFTHCFDDADFAIIQEIYDVAGREEDADAAISSQQLVDAVEKTGKYALYAADVVTTRQHLDTIMDSNDVVIIMGAGDVYHLAEELVSEQV